MDHLRWILVVGAALAILTCANATPFSDAEEPKILTLVRHPRGASASERTQERLKSCLVQSGFANVHCTDENGYVRCLSGGLDYTPTGNVIAMALGVAIGIICVAAFGCYCWTRSGRRQGAAVPAHQARGAPQAPTARGSTTIRFLTPGAQPATLGSGFHKL